MLKRIKYYLFKIILAKKKKLILLSFFVLFGLFLIPKPVRADFFGIADSFWGLLESQLDALDFGEGAVLQLIFYLILLLAQSQALLYLSAALLEWAINFPINLGVTTINPLITSGWQFTSGLVNALFILIFVVIALAYILGIETFGAKKALPRLIIVALLINFSPVFIGAVVDIVQLTLKAIVNALGPNLPSLAIAPLTSSLWNFITGYFFVIGVYTVVALIPYANVAGMVALIAAVVAEAFLGTFSLSVLLIVLGFAVGLLFLFYFLIFIIRVAMIWMLTILAPLAFAALVLPATQKYWKQWLQLLLEWLFFGIIVVLLGGLGLKLFAENTVVPFTGPISIGSIGLFPAFTYNYLFLLIYLGIIFYYSKKKFAPELATVLINQGIGLAKRARPMARRAKEGVQEWARGQERMQAWARRQAEAKLPGVGVKGRKGILMRGLAKPFWAVRRGVGRAIGPSIIEEEKRKITKAESEADKTKEASLLFSKFKDAMDAGRLSEAIGYLSKSIEKGGAFKKLFQKEVEEGEAIRLAKRANELGAVPEAERIALAVLDRFTTRKEQKVKLKEMGFKSRVDLEKEFDDLHKEAVDLRGKRKIKESRAKAREARAKAREIKEWDDKGYETIADKMIDKARKDEVKNFATGFWENKLLLNAAQKFWGGPQLAKAADEFGRSFVDTYMDRAEDKDRGIKWFLENNQKALLYLAGNAAQDLGFRSFDLGRKEVREEIKEYRKERRREEGRRQIRKIRKRAEEELERLGRGGGELPPSGPPTPPSTPSPGSLPPSGPAAPPPPSAPPPSAPPTLPPTTKEEERKLSQYYKNLEDAVKARKKLKETKEKIEELKEKIQRQTTEGKRKDRISLSKRRLKTLEDREKRTKEELRKAESAIEDIIPRLKTRTTPPSREKLEKDIEKLSKALEEELIRRRKKTEEESEESFKAFKEKLRKTREEILERHKKALEAAEKEKKKK